MTDSCYNTECEDCIDHVCTSKSDFAVNCPIRWKDESDIPAGKAALDCHDLTCPANEDADSGHPICGSGKAAAKVCKLRKLEGGD